MFHDIDFAYNNSSAHDTLSTMLDELLKDQPEVVRCKDCAYWQDNNDGYPHTDCKWNQDETPDPDDYCSGGVPKD